MGDDVVVKLHSSEIVRLQADGELVLNSTGWRTVSTLEAINNSVRELVPHTSLELVADGDEWSLRDGSGS
eukprot:3824164-Prymnesium_polylepis.1